MLKSVLPLSFIIATRFFGLFIVLPVLSLYALELRGANSLLIGLLVGIYALMQMLLQTPFGILSDKIGRKKTMLLGLVIFIIGSLLCAGANDIYTMLLGRILQGSGAIGGVASAMISDFIPEEKRSKAMAMMGGFIGIAFAASMVISPWMSAKWGLSSLFELSAALSFFCIILLYTAVPKEEKITHTDEKTSLVSLLKEKNLSLLNATNFLQKMLLSLSFLLIPIFLTKSAFQLPKENLFEVYLGAMLFGFLAMGFAGALGERRGKSKFLLLLGVLLFTSSYIIFALSPLLASLEWGIGVFISGVVVFFIAFNLHEPLMQSCASKFCKAHSKGAALGLFNVFGYAGGLAGGVAGGLILKFQNPTLLYALVFLCLFWFLALCFLKNPSDFKNLYLSAQKLSPSKNLKEHPAIVEVYQNTGGWVVKFDSAKISQKELEKILA
ncbi:MFS transporter [Campylobacter sp.]|uniref:MFS transporter n=1 Tax=Campylobacter sp. TaxID=205 RepID=UPI0026DC8881|nr:MFS transporter [Campylobacter sp.]MDO4674032.1 MFS transporter [Campylobacter sp.]